MAGIPTITPTQECFINKKSQDSFAELSDTRQLVIDKRALNRLAPTVQTTQAKSRGTLALIHTPNIDQIWAKLKNVKYFSTLDIRSGFHHMPIKKEDRHKTAFVVDSYCKFQWCRTPFGLEQAPARFNSLMLKIFFLYMDNFMIFYVDDLLIYSITEQEHLEHLRLVFEKLRQSGLKLKFKKCALFKSQIEYLGHLITTEGIKPLTDKIDTILRLQPATTVTEVKHIIGITNYYKKFLPLLSKLIRPLHQLTRKNVPFEWTTDCQNSLDCLKHTITSAPILIYPEPTKLYMLYTDSSKYTWAGILTKLVYIHRP